jgi:hypothetical protein
MPSLGFSGNLGSETAFESGISISIKGREGLLEYDVFVVRQPDAAGQKASV